VATLDEANAILEAQRAEQSGDAALLRRAALWRDASPEECFAEVIALCKDADYYLGLLTADQLERALTPDPLPTDTIALLRARRASPRG
jgi:hypothetical protein